MAAHLLSHSAPLSMRPWTDFLLLPPLGNLVFPLPSRSKSTAPTPVYTRWALLLFKKTKSEKHPSFTRVFFLVPGQGFEPRLPGPKPGVLPLDDPGSSTARIILHSLLFIKPYTFKYFLIAKLVDNSVTTTSTANSMP
jgi:hypothetical protein